MLDAGADQLCGAGRYERSQARQDTRAGSYERALQTSAGEVSLKVPKLRRPTFETAIIDHGPSDRRRTGGGCIGCGANCHPSSVYLAASGLLFAC
ncbi:MAG: transposase [Xanthobacteraceae bacterium]